jgi:hypothetical protein
MAGTRAGAAKDETFMNDDPTADDCTPSASGIKACLRMLADEAASLGLVRTTLALGAALDLCEAETIGGELGTLASATNGATLN